MYHKNHLLNIENTINSLINNNNNRLSAFFIANIPVYFIYSKVNN